ncbi:hypothetical protein ACWC5I_02910 [Kitasatospora sp. NPDC001574]
MSGALTCPDFLDGRGCGHIQPITGDVAAAKALLRDHLRGMHGGAIWSDKEADEAANRAQRRDLEHVLGLRDKARRQYLARRGW